MATNGTMMKKNGSRKMHAEIKTSEDKREEYHKAEMLAGMWLYRANLAAEKGDHEKEQRHLARAQKWLDRMNELDGLV